MKEKKKNNKNKKNTTEKVELKKEVVEETEIIEEEVKVEVTEDKEDISIEEEIKKSDEIETEELEDDKTEEYDFYRPTISSSTYGETVDSLVKEVQLFHEEGDIVIPKKSKLWLIIGAILFVVIIGIVIFLITNNDNKNTKKDNKSNEVITYDYKYKELEDRIEFYDGDRLIDTYTCMSKNCSAYSFGRYGYFGIDKTVIAINDDKSVFLYDYIEKKTISSLYVQLQNLIKDNETVAFIAYSADNLVGVIDLSGEIVIPIEYDAIGYSIGGGDVSDYSYEYDLITVKQDGLWGLLSLTDGSKLLDNQYEDIFYNEHNNVVVNIEGFWYLLNLKGEKILEDGYDMIIPTKSYIFVSANNLFSILNYKGNNIISKEISTYIKAFRDRNKTIIPAFKLEIDGTIININIMKSETNYIEYKFNTVNGELTEVIK